MESRHSPEEKHIIVPIDGRHEFKLAILEVNDDRSQVRAGISESEEKGPNGEKIYFALFNKDETDFKIEGVNQGLRRAMVTYEVKGKSDGSFVYPAGDTFKVETLDDGPNKSMLHCISQSLKEGRDVVVKEAEEKNIAINRASISVAEIKVHFYREQCARQGDDIRLAIKWPQHNETRIVVGTLDRVKDLKEAVERMTRIQQNDQRLILDGIELNDDAQTLEGYGIGEQSVVEVKKGDDLNLKIKTPNETFDLTVSNLDTLRDLKRDIRPKINFHGEIIVKLGEISLEEEASSLKDLKIEDESMINVEFKEDPGPPTAPCPIFASSGFAESMPYPGPQYASASLCSSFVPMSAVPCSGYSSSVISLSGRDEISENQSNYPIRERMSEELRSGPRLPPRCELQSASRYSARRTSRNISVDRIGNAEVHREAAHGISMPTPTAMMSAPAAMPPVPTPSSLMAITKGRESHQQFSDVDDFLPDFDYSVQPFIIRLGKLSQEEAQD